MEQKIQLPACERFIFVGIPKSKEEIRLSKVRYYGLSKQQVVDLLLQVAEQYQKEILAEQKSNKQVDDLLSGTGICKN